MAVLVVSSDMDVRDGMASTRKRERESESA
jgi:hypothetical protein